LIRKSRFIVAIGLVMALAVSGLAFAAGSDENEAGVVGKVKPSKLDKKKYKKVALFAGVTTTTTHEVPGQQNPEAEFIEFGKNLKLDNSKADFCTADLNQTTTDQAKAACPAGSDLGTGSASANLGSAGNRDDIVVTAFNGPGKNQLRLHAFSPTLGASLTQVVDGFIVKAKTAGYGQALSVPNAPDLGNDAFLLTSFNTNIDKGTGVVTARCKAKKFLFKRTVTYDDGSEEVATLTQKCKRKNA
jgi:hypothetical protein